MINAQSTSEQSTTAVRLQTLAHQRTRRGKIVWTLGTLLLVIGFYLMAYLGGLYADAAFNRMAARGDNTLPAPVVLAGTDVPAALSVPPPQPFTAPSLASLAVPRGTIADRSQQPHASLVSRVVIPKVNVDSKVVEVGWDIVEQEGQQIAIWQVAEYAVGQHRGSANPGEGSNIVLAGHVGGLGEVFRDLYFVEPGDAIVLYSNGEQYRYEVREKIIVDEEGVPLEQRLANARFIEPTESEVVTLLTCWPPSGPYQFTQRIIVRATPFGGAQLVATSPVSNWTIR